MSRTSQVVPAILTDDPKALETMIRQAETFTTYVQIDIMDGQFVPSYSITSEHLASLPTKLNWEAHLMVQNPANYLKDFRDAGAQRIVFHYEATDSPEKVISMTRNLDLEVGLAINPETSIPDFLTLADEVDNVLFLSVNPGFYGAKFIPEVLDKIAEFHNLRPDIEIGIDGGIKESNITRIARTGIDVIYTGSAIFMQPEPGESFRKLCELARKASPS